MRTDIFGFPVKYEVWNKQNALPLYLAGSYDFKTVYIANKRCIMMTPTEELATLPALKKHISKIREVDNVPVILRLGIVSSYRRKSLIENNMPFITEKQAFLPFLGAMLTDEKETEKNLKKFTPSTQQVFLFYFYSKKKQLYISEAGKALPFTAMTLTRAVRQLEATGLFAVTKNGVNKIIESKYGRKELLEKARLFLSTPVRIAGYIDKSQITADMVYAGETALAEKTMLNTGRVITCAVYEKRFDKKIMTDELIDPQKQVRVELWTYDPGMFSKDNIADDISVALSFSKNVDERIQEAVEELIERELWEK